MRRTLICSILLFLTVQSPSTVSAASLVWLENVPVSFSWRPMRVAKWTHGNLVDVQNDGTAHPLIWLQNRQASHSIPFTIEGAQVIRVYDWDVAIDGSIALSGSATDVSGRGSQFVAKLSADGSHALITRTLRYRPLRIAIASDGTLWTVGQDFTPNEDLGVLRHFDQSGALMATFIPQSTVPSPVVLSSPHNRLLISNDRVAWYSPTMPRYVEISLDGKLMLDASVQPVGDKEKGYGVVLTDSGNLFLSALHDVPGTGAGPPAHVFGIYMLDRSSGNWITVVEQQQTVVPIGAQPVPNQIGHICGIDGSNIVMISNHLIRFCKIAG
jgi:hypothetical protein